MNWKKIQKRKTLGEFPQEASVNLQVPELPTSSQVIIKQDKRVTGRTTKVSFTSHPKFVRELKKLAFEEDCPQIEILEKALKLYQKQRSKRCFQCRKLVKKDETEECDNCGKGFCSECLTYYGKDSELVFCRNCGKD